jgi:hypothetical protein
MTAPETFGIVPMKTVRDSYAGAVASRHAKCKIEISRYAIRRSAGKGDHDLKQIFGGLIKLAENRIRTYFGVKSRFSPTGLDASMRDEIAAYFQAVYPDPIRKKHKKEDEEEAYMALYEPKQTGRADIGRALAIEEQAWETAELLATDEDEDVSFEFSADTEDALFAASPEEAPAEEKIQQSSADGSFHVFEDLQLSDDADGDFEFIRTTLTEAQREALCAAVEGRFPEYCRSVGRMEDLVRGELNEIAMETLGDIILEEDFSPVSDYLQEIKDMLYTDK